MKWAMSSYQIIGEENKLIQLKTLQTTGVRYINIYGTAQNVIEKEEKNTYFWNTVAYLTETFFWIWYLIKFLIKWMF